MNSVWNKEEYANTAQRGRSCAMSNIGMKNKGQGSLLVMITKQTMQFIEGSTVCQTNLGGSRK